jgi:hypothetical protein
VIELRADALDPFLAINGAVERLQPLWRVYPAQVEQISELVLPEGWRWRNDDETLEAGDPTFRYRRAVARGEGKVVVRQSYEALADHVAVDAMASHFEARRKALDALGVRLSLAVPEHAARSDRDRRLRGLLREIMNDRRETSGKER